MLPAALGVALKKGLIGAARFSGVITLLALIGPLFMLEVYDRVIPSRSLPTFGGVGQGWWQVCAPVFAVVDIIRSRVMSRHHHLSVKCRYKASRAASPCRCRLPAAEILSRARRAFQQRPRKPGSLPFLS